MQPGNQSGVYEIDSKIQNVEDPRLLTSLPRYKCSLYKYAYQTTVMPNNNKDEFTGSDTIDFLINQSDDSLID